MDFFEMIIHVIIMIIVEFIIKKVI